MWAVIATPVVAQLEGEPLFDDAFDSSFPGESEALLSEPAQASSSAFAKIIGTEILGGVMEIDKRVSRTRVGLTVNLLAASDLSEWQYPDQVATLKLSNSQLGDMASIARSIAAVGNPQQREILTEAFAYLQDEDRIYSRYWKPDPVTTTISGFSLADLLSDSDILASEYFSLLRERNIARNLFLNEQRLSYSLRLAPAGYEPTPFDDALFTVDSDDVEWEIRIFRSVHVPAPNKVAYYRFAVRAVAEPHDFVIPSSYWLEEGTPEVRATAHLIKEGGQVIALNNYESLTIPENTGVEAFEPVVAGFQDKLDVATGEDVPNRLRHVLSFVGGKGAISGLVSRALTQSPVDNNSIVSGGLIGFSGDNGPEALVGVNQGFASLGKLDAGVLVGATPEADTSIFIGPSLQYSLVTLGVGARISGEDSLEVETAGVLSVDLSRLLQDEADGPEMIAIGNPRAGGTLGELVSKVAQDQMIVLASMETPVTLRETAAIDFTRTHTDIGCRVPVASEPVDPTDVSALSEVASFEMTESTQHFRFVPKGCYEAKANFALMEQLDNYDIYIGDTLFENGTYFYEVDSDTLQDIELYVVPR